MIDASETIETVTVRASRLPPFWLLAAVGVGLLLLIPTTRRHLMRELRNLKMAL